MRVTRQFSAAAASRCIDVGLGGSVMPAYKLQAKLPHARLAQTILDEQLHRGLVRRPGLWSR